MVLRFEWDKQKAITNIRKRVGVSFEEATTVFDDPRAVIFDDEAHSTHDPREIMVGCSAKNRLLLVCFTEREDDVVRIYSARLATKKERLDHERYFHRRVR